jgi:uncharacterized protein YkwD
MDPAFQDAGVGYHPSPNTSYTHLWTLVFGAD